MTKVYTSLGKVRSTGVAVAFAVAAICVSFQFSADARAAQSAQELTEAAKRQAAEAKERAAKLKPATVSNQKRVEEVAETGRERGQAEFERRAALERAKHDAAVAKAGADEAGTEAKPKAPPTELSGRLVVAISSSIPDDLVREYMRQLDGVPEAIVVLRGFVGGARTVGPTGVWIERVRRKQPACRECAHFAVEVVVDPLAYQMLGIEKVPAFAYLPGVQNLRHCDAEVLASSSVAYGSVSVAAAMKAVKSKSVEVPPELIKKLGG